MVGLSLSMFAIVSIAISFIMFAGYLVASIWASYHIVKVISKESQKIKPDDKFIIPITTVTLFVLPITLDAFFFLNALKFIYYKLYIMDLHSHVNMSKLVSPNIHFGSFYALLIAMIFTLFAYLIAPFVTERVVKLSKKDSLN